MANHLNGGLKRIAFAGRFLSDMETKYATNELDLFAVLWGPEHFRMYIDGNRFENEALETLIKKNRSNKTNIACLTSWLVDRLHVTHVAGKHHALTDYSRRNPVDEPQAEDAF